MATRSFLAAVLMSLFAAGPAEGAPFGPDEEWAFAQAASYWGASPPCSSLQKEVVVGLPDAGRAHHPEVGEGPCLVQIAAGMGRGSLCAVMLHEYGHLLGYGHEDPPMLVDAGAVPQCAPALAEQSIERGREQLREQRAYCRSLRAGKAKSRCWRVARRMRTRLL